MKKCVSVYKNENVYAGLCSFLTAFVFLFNSPTNIWRTADIYKDSSVFKTVTIMMEHGFMPYKDSFDHKGPLLYLLNYIGNRFSDYRGIWFIELLFLTVTILLIFKIARLSTSVVPSIVVTFVSLSLLFKYFEGGNLTEEYAMAFIAVSLYIFLDYFLNDTVSAVRLCICGICFGAVLLLRPNMIAVWICFSIAVLVKAISEKKLYTIIPILGWFVLGVLIIGLPVIVWLLKNGCLRSCWEAYILFNKRYMSAEGGRAVFRTKWNSFFVFLNTSICLLAVFLQTYVCVVKKHLVDYAYLSCMVVSLLFICLSGRTYGHYGMTLVPLIAYPLCHLFVLFDDVKARDTSKALKLIVCLYLLIAIVLPEWLPLLAEVPTIYSKRNNDQRSEVVKEIGAIVMANTSEDEEISVYGSWDIIYVVSNRMHATRYSYQYPIGSMFPDIMDDYMKELGEETPKIVVVEEKRYDERIRSFLEENHYSLYWSQKGDSTDGALVFMK